MAQAVVDHLEAVQVDEQHGQLLAQAIAARDAVGDPIEKQSAVGQASQRVVKRAVAQLLLEHFALRGSAQGTGSVLGELAGTSFVA